MTEVRPEILRVMGDSTFESPTRFLKVPTPIGWAEQALSDLPSFLNDHASCERKASATCMSILTSHPEFAVLHEPMIRLAREELEHFHQVWRLLEARGWGLRREMKDAYVNELRVFLRDDKFRLMDRLLVSAIIEARSCERLGLVADVLTDPELKRFYTMLTRAESRHFVEFTDLANSLFPDHAPARLEEMLVAEGAIMMRMPWTSAVH